ncbi:hypothetical protein PR202_gb12469 [Eleusine coracana subsp. coracana]|uniref:Uncharacterized protein n=1 Tax=Eleusine coracana subsp. coracana TaxID=191504 RepID=A0AAV5EN41_ELECO|nr:hypothetical protein PR202_gb12469 [Eleusine coracana subsp. coracana]
MCATWRQQALVGLDFVPMQRRERPGFQATVCTMYPRGLPPPAWLEKCKKIPEPSEEFPTLVRVTMWFEPVSERGINSERPCRLGRFDKFSSEASLCLSGSSDAHRVFTPRAGPLACRRRRIEAYAPAYPLACRRLLEAGLLACHRRSVERCHRFGLAPSPVHPLATAGGGQAHVSTRRDEQRIEEEEGALMNGEPVRYSVTARATSPSMARRPFQSSALAFINPPVLASAVSPWRSGTSDATESAATVYANQAWPVPLAQLEC